MELLIAFCFIGALILVVLYFWVNKKDLSEYSNESRGSKQVRTLQDKYDPNKGGVSSKFGKWQSSNRTEYADQLTMETMSATNLSTAQIGAMSAQQEVERTPARLEAKAKVEEATEAIAVDTAEFTQ